MAFTRAPHDDADAHAAALLDVVGFLNVLRTTGGLRTMWLDNFDDARRPPPPAEPLTCARLGSLAVPVLALEAESGMPYSRLIVQRLAGCVPRCEHVVVPGVTHFMSYQAPSSFNTLVLDFIAEHGGG